MLSLPASQGWVTFPQQQRSALWGPSVWAAGAPVHREAGRWHSGDRSMRQVVLSPAPAHTQEPSSFSRCHPTRGATVIKGRSLHPSFPPFLLLRVQCIRGGLESSRESVPSLFAKECDRKFWRQASGARVPETEG